MFLKSSKAISWTKRPFWNSIFNRQEVACSTESFCQMPIVNVHTLHLVISILNPFMHLTSKYLAFCILNLRSIISKPSFSRKVHYVYLPDSHLVTEAWLNDIICDSSIALADCDFFRHNRAFSCRDNTHIFVRFLFCSFYWLNKFGLQNET